jgi:diketogulonate reductase-like aldo/keto reductase
MKEISTLGLGTYKLKTQEEITHSMCCAIESGYRMFDTAALYKNEKYIKNFIYDDLQKYGLTRSDIWITSKVAYFTMLDGEDAIRKSIENSLECFGGYIDLLLIHASNSNDILTWYILREYQNAGKICYVGISNYNVERLQKFCETIGEDEVKKIYVNQIEFNPYLNRYDLVQLCKSYGIKVIAYGSLYKACEKVKMISEKYNVSCESVLLKWSVQSGCIVIPMSRDKVHITENFNSVYGEQYTLTSSEMKQLNMLDEGYTKFKKHL